MRKHAYHESPFSALNRGNYTARERFCKPKLHYQQKRKGIPCHFVLWPLAAAADAKPMGDWTVVTRDDGSKQWAYKGKPLYSFAKDKMPGDTTGNGFLNNAWHIAKP
jgi:hypothetical protein